ncbi:TBC1 domain family member 22B-like protein, partial [Euroglyphus maynei]
MNNKHKFGNNKSSILIKEIPSSESVQNDNESPSKQSEEEEVESKASYHHDSEKPKNGDPKLAKLKKLLYEDEITDLSLLRTITWSGISDEVRPLAWKLLLGYLPPVRSKRPIVSENKKTEYQNLVAQYYNNRQDNDEMYRQIHIDIPRMQPLITIFQQPIVQDMFKRILYIWSIRHPASGYVQGMNDLVTPFFVTYLSEFVPRHSFADVESFDVSTLTDEALATIEADSYWSFNKLLDSIQDNYTFAQPGIQRLVNLLSRVVSRVDKKLHEHLENNSVQYIQFAFRWMNNLLIREIPLRCIIRLWDTYLSEGTLSSTY